MGFLCVQHGDGMETDRGTKLLFQRLLRESLDRVVFKHRPEWSE